MRILSIDGGGYLGLASACFLAELERHFGATCHESFDMFCGTSTGAIIALALAHGLTATQICDLYRSFGPQVFWNPIRPIRLLRLIRGILCSRYTNGALRKALEDTFEDCRCRNGERCGPSVLAGGRSSRQQLLAPRDLL